MQISVVFSSKVSFCPTHILVSFPIPCMHVECMACVIVRTYTNSCVQIHIAAANGYGDVMKYLVKRGADLNVQDDSGSTPLHVAAKFGQVSFFWIWFCI